jgi:ABC-2 type transport system permease protein
MNTQSNAVPESLLGSQGIAPAAMSATRPMYWSVRRELGENRSIYIAPLARMSHSGGRGAATISSTR